MDGGVTKSGKKMRPVVRRRLVKILADPAYDGWERKRLAKEIGISERTMRDYLTGEVMAEIRELRLEGVSEEDLKEVDRAMLERAKQGSVAAARLIYARISGLKDGLAGLFDEGRVPTVEELEEEVRRLKQGSKVAR